MTEGDSYEEPPSLDELLNTPIKIFIRTDEEIEDVPLSLPVDVENLSTDEIKALLKSKKPTCSGITASYACGNHEAVPQYSGEIISVAAGDEIAMNSLILSVVNIDGSGNGAGLIKVPLMNNIKLGVNLSGIQVAKGGCIIAGRAELSGVEASILTAQQREKLAAAYAVFMEATQLGIDNAGAIAKSYNTFTDKLTGIKDQANSILAKIKGGNKPSPSELLAMKTLADNIQASMKAASDKIMADAKGKVDADAKAVFDAMQNEIATSIAQIDKAASDNAAERDEAIASLEKLKEITPTEIEEKLKAMLSLAIMYVKNGKAQILTEDASEVYFNQTENEVFLKNHNGKAISWTVEDNNGMNQAASINGSSSIERLSFTFPAGINKLKLTAASNGKSFSVWAKGKPALIFDNFYVADAKHSDRKAKQNETLYLVGEGGIEAVVNGTEKEYRHPFTHDNISWSVIREGQSNPKPNYNGKSMFRHKFSTSFVSLSDSYRYKVEASNAAVGTKGVSANVVVVDEAPYYKEDAINFKFKDELIKVLDYTDWLIAYSPFPVLNNKAKYLSDKGFSIYIKPKFVRQGGNKESTKSRLYYSETKHSLSVEVGMKGEKEFPVPGLALPPLDLSYWGCDITVKAGVFWKIDGKAAGEIGKTWTKLDYFEDNTLDSEKTTIAPLCEGYFLRTCEKRSLTAATKFM